MPPLATGQKAITATAAQLSSTEVNVETVILKALPSNAITVYFGPVGVTTSTGYPLGAGEEFLIAPGNDNLKKTPKLNEIYVIASTTGASMAWVATPR